MNFEISERIFVGALYNDNQNGITTIKKKNSHMLQQKRKRRVSPTPIITSIIKN